MMDGGTVQAWGYVAAAILSAGISGYFGIKIARMARLTSKQVTPSNGTSTAKMIELLVIAVDQQKQLLASEQERVNIDRVLAAQDRALMAEHIETDRLFAAKVEPFLVPHLKPPALVVEHGTD